MAQTGELNGKDATVPVMCVPNSSTMIILQLSPPLCCRENRKSPAPGRLKDKGGTSQAQGGGQLKGGRQVKSAPSMRFQLEIHSRKTIMLHMKF